MVLSGAKGYDRLHRRTHDPHVAHVIEGVIGVAQVVEPAASLRRVGIGPAGAGPKGVEIEVQRESGEGVGRAVGVADAFGAAQHAARLIQPGLDLISDLLLPVGARMRRGRRLLEEEERQADHGCLEVWDRRSQESSARNIGIASGIWHHGACERFTRPCVTALSSSADHRSTRFGGFGMRHLSLASGTSGMGHQGSPAMAGPGVAVAAVRLRGADNRTKGRQAALCRRREGPRASIRRASRRRSRLRSWSMRSSPTRHEWIHHSIPPSPRFQVAARLRGVQRQQRPTTRPSATTSGTRKRTTGNGRSPASISHCWSDTACMTQPTCCVDRSFAWCGPEDR